MILPVSSTPVQSSPVHPRQLKCIERGREGERERGREGETDDLVTRRNLQLLIKQQDIPTYLSPYDGIASPTGLPGTRYCNETLDRTPRYSRYMCALDVVCHILGSISD
jgi:hypothetical protein